MQYRDWCTVPVFLLNGYWISVGAIHESPVMEVRIEIGRFMNRPYDVYIEREIVWSSTLWYISLKKAYTRKRR